MQNFGGCRNHEQGKRDFVARMDEIDRELGKEGGPYFLGWGYSMVDIVFAPFLERIAASIPYYKVPPCCCASEPLDSKESKL